MIKNNDGLGLQLVYWFAQIAPLAMYIYSFVLILFAAQTFQTAQTMMEPWLVDMYWNPLRNVAVVLYIFVIILFTLLKKNKATTQKISYTSLLLSAIASLLSYTLADLTLRAAVALYIILMGITIQN